MYLVCHEIFPLVDDTNLKTPRIDGIRNKIRGPMFLRRIHYDWFGDGSAEDDSTTVALFKEAFLKLYTHNLKENFLI